MDYRSLLNPIQYQAVTSTAQHLRIVAGAGSGKTRVLTYRISYLIGELNINPKRILAIAFTNKVAREMKERAVALVPEAENFLHIMTFHSFCARFLRIESSAIGYPNNYTIFDEDDQANLVKEICVGRGYKKKDEIVKESLHYIRRKKTKGQYPADVVLSIKAEVNNEKECLDIYAEYEERKASMFALDFDDLLLQTIAVLENYDAIREKWQRKFDHILVDEFQDTNDVQFHLIELLMTPITCLYVVGDPDQTIYTWRGANQKIILDFEKTFPGAETIILNQNYRSTEVILNAANKLISHNKKRVPKDLFTQNKDGEKIVTHRASTAEEEALLVAKHIKSIARFQDGDYSNIAVLYRSSYVTRPFESQFASDGIPYRIFGGLRFYQRKEVKDALAYFRLLVNPLDDISFDRIVNVPRRGIGDTSLEILKREAKEKGLSEYNYISQISAGSTDLKSKTITALLLLQGKMEQCKKAIEEGSEVFSAPLRKFITEIGYFDYLVEEEAPDEDRVGNVNALFDDINHFISNNPDSTFDDYLQNVSLLTSQDDMNGGNYVSLMTIHVAKGLEFDNVFVIGMGEGSFPSQRALSEDDRDGEEEERRLAYVAMTRARKRLYLTCNSAYSYIVDSKMAPSRFFEEAGLKFPPSQDDSLWGASRKPFGSRGSYGAYGGYGRSSDWKPVKNPKPASSFSFDDGDAIDPFEKAKPKQVEAPKRESNGITDWKIGDIAIHEKFGEGVVTAVISNSIIVIDFASQGKKTLLSDHPSLTRKASKGGLA